MGLDMYLKKKTYVKNWGHMAPEELHSVTVLKNGTPVSHIKPERISGIEESVGYWRKANAIHKWFVDNVQDGNDDCKEYYVDTTQLQELLDACKQVKENHELAPELLPTEGGFFFGSTDYDEWYYQDIDHTIEMIEGLRAEIEPGKDYYPGSLYYQSSW